MIWNKSEVTTAWMLMTFSSSYVKTADEAPDTTQRSASHRDIGQSILHQQLYNNLFSSKPRPSIMCLPQQLRLEHRNCPHNAK